MGSIYVGGWVCVCVCVCFPSLIPFLSSPSSLSSPPGKTLEEIETLLKQPNYIISSSSLDSPTSSLNSSTPPKGGTLEQRRSLLGEGEVKSSA